MLLSMKSDRVSECRVCGAPWGEGSEIWYAKTPEGFWVPGFYCSVVCAKHAMDQFVAGQAAKPLVASVPTRLEAPNAVPAAYSGTPVTVSPSMGTTTTHSESHREPQHSESWEPEEVCDRPESTQERIERMHEDNVYSMNRIVSAIDKLREALCGVQLK